MKLFLLYIFVTPAVIFGQGNFYDRNKGLENYLDSVDQIADFDSLLLNNESFSDRTYDGGSYLKAYFSDGELYKIKSWFGLSYGNNSCEYYLKNKELYLVIEKFNGFEYDEKTESFNYQVYDIGANGFYVFDNKKLIDVTSLGHWRFEDDTVDPEILLQEEFSSYLKIIRSHQNDSKLLNVRLFSDDSKLTYDTTISIGYLKDSLDLFLLSKFNYEPFENKLINDSTLVLKQESYQIEICSKKVDTSIYELSFIQNGQILDKINGLKIWGIDGNIPNRVISSIKLTNEINTNSLDSNNFINLFEPSIYCQKSRCMTNAYLTDENNLIISMFNSDGAGGYTAIFIFDNSLKIIDRIVGYGF